MKTRIISAAVMVPLLVLALVLGGAVFHTLLLLMSLVAVFEMTRALKKSGIKPLVILNYIYAVLAALTVYLNKSDNLFIAFVLVALICLVVTMLLPKYDLKNGIATVFVMFYPTTLIAIIGLVEHMGWIYIVAGIIASVITDTAAYFTGKFLGKRKLCPEISPNKTVAGAVGGALSTLVLLSVYGILCTVFTSHEHTISATQCIAWIVLSFCCGVFAQFGDLFASSIKRYCNIKDFSNLIPGHGGIVDRVDSIVFTTFLVYMFKSMGII